jgi:hypothetical protein
MATFMVLALRLSRGTVEPASTILSQPRLDLSISNNNNNNYTFPVRRLGVHLDHLKITR